MASMDVSKSGVDPEYSGDDKKRMKLPVYHAQKEDGVVTIKLNIKPRLIERTFFIVIILALVSTIVFKPAFLFGPMCPIDSMQDTNGIEVQQPVALQPEVPAAIPQANTSAPIPPPEAAVTPPPVAQTNVSNVTEETNVTAVTTPVSTQKDINPSLIAFQVTGFTVEQKAENWYKLKGVEVKITNNNEIKFIPTIKVWYYDDATENYFNENSPVKDQQSLSVGMEPKTTRTFSLSNLDESFSGSDLHPTVLVKLYDLKTGKVMKEITKEVEFEE